MGGGGKGSSSPAPIRPMQTTSSVGDIAEGSGATLTEDETKTREEAVARKREGTRGLRIPLKSRKSTTKTPGSTGVNV
ncbi:MAG: hypothetical protein B6U76_00070 [Desulfurococcales archaeon ex4484_217_2]|nr:MAG: hypothetical protein B6U76_00070 [Desulfurococcales archaeon ex4484_217_2]